MPAMRIIAGLSTGRAVRVQAQGGATRDLPRAPSEFNTDGGTEIALLERQGRESLTRVDGPKKDTLSFQLTLGHTDWTRSVQSQVDWLTTQRDEGRRIKFSGMPRQFSGWWHIRSMPVSVTRMTPGHQISRATLELDLVAALDFTGKVQRTPPPPPRKPKAAAAKTPVARTHTVVTGDWLSKIAGRYLGDIKRWPEIYELNRSTIRNPDLIQPGWVLRIPPK